MGGNNDETVLDPLVRDNLRRDRELLDLHNQFKDVSGKLDDILLQLAKLGCSQAPSTSLLGSQAPPSSAQLFRASSTVLRSAPVKETSESYVQEEAARARAPLRAARRGPAPINLLPATFEDEDEDDDVAYQVGSGEGSGAFAKDDIKLDIPNFDGGEDPEEFLDWCRTMERICDYKNFTEVKMFKVAVMKLTKYASLWYDNFKATREKKGKRKTRTWSELKKHMMKRFVPFDYRQSMFMKLQDLVQGSSTVSSYVHEFEKLQLICGLDELEELKIARFVRGLNRMIRSRLDLHLYVSFHDVAKRAISIEHDLMEDKSTGPISAKPSAQGRGFGFRGNNPPAQHHAGAGANTSVNAATSATHSWHANDPRGKAPMNPNEIPIVPNVANKNKRCFKCMGFGHFQNECPSQRLTFVQHGDEDSTKDCVEIEDDEAKEEIIEQHAEEGEMLMLRRMLHAKALPSDEVQRENIFHTRCRVGTKVAGLVIDSGACANVVSQKLVEKLALPCTVHPSPYKLHWLNDASGLKVAKQCLISFNIGASYCDQVLCDVIPMDACHILLGRPWQFDREAVHDGKANTYSFPMGTKKIVLKPLEPHKPSAKGKEVVLAGEHPAVKELAPDQKRCLLGHLGGRRHSILEQRKRKLRPPDDEMAKELRAIPSQPGEDDASRQAFHFARLCPVPCTLRALP